MVQHDADGLLIEILPNGNVRKAYSGAISTSAWVNFNREVEFYQTNEIKLHEITPHIPHVIQVSASQIVLEHGGVSLDTVIGKLTQADLHSIVFQIAYTVKCMKSLGICHNDLYCNSNVLVRNCPGKTHTYTIDDVSYCVPWNWKVCIIDFDLATWDEDIVDSDMFDVMESLHYFLPAWIPSHILDDDVSPISVLNWVMHLFRL